MLHTAARLACGTALLLSVDGFSTSAAFGRPARVGKAAMGLQAPVKCVSSRRRALGLRMSENQDSLKKVKQEVEDEKAKIAALVGESSATLPEVADMMSEKGNDGGPSKPEFKSSVVQPKPFENPDKSPPPRSFQMCVEQAYLSAKAAIDEGYKLLEVEFPPLPQSAIDNGAIGAYTILDANIQHARGFAKFFEGKNVAIVFSDAEERNMFVDDETYGMLTPRRPGSVRYSALGGGWKGSWFSQIKVADVQDDDDMFIIIGASAQELPDVKALCERAGDRPVVLFNMKLQILRGDLGLPFFPGKDLHNDWLSSALPVYHVRPTPYTRTISTPPFLINYSGAIFRTFPGKWQALLEVPDTVNGGGRYERVKNLEKRPALSEMREILAEELQLDALDGEEGQKVLGIDLKTLRSGVVVKTWWEDKVEDTKSDNWRS